MHISVKIHERINNVFQLFVGPSSPEISNWIVPYINVPTQNPKKDCTFFYMIFLESYNDRDWEVDIQIDKVS
jgi:hypothetical protein